MIGFSWKAYIAETLVKFVFGLGIGISSAHEESSINQDVNLEQFISNQVPAHCDLVIFNDDPKRFFNFLPINRPTVVFNLNEQSKKFNDGERQNKIHPWFKLKFASVCHVLVIFGVRFDRLMSYDNFVKSQFNKINLILIFPMMENLHSEDILRYRRRINIFHHNIGVIDHSTGRVLFATKSRFCKSDDPLCVLRGVSKKFGYKTIPPHLHIRNWEEYASAGLHYPPIELHPNSPSSVLDLVEGLEGQLLKHLVHEYKMNLTLMTPKDMAYGVLLTNDTWTGSFGLLESEEVDFIGGMMAGNWERGFLGIYLAPLYNIQFSFITRKHPKSFGLTAPFTVLSESVWAAVFGSFVLTLVFMTCVSKLRAHYVDEGLDFRHLSSDNSSLFWQLAMSALRQPLQKTPGGPTSLTFTSWSVCLFIIFSVYSSYLTARLSVPDPERYINTMRDVWQTQKTFIVWPGGTVDLYMKTSSDPDTKRVMDRYHRYSNTIFNGTYTYMQAVDDYRYVISPEIKGFQYKLLAMSDGVERKLRHYHVAKEPLINVFCSWIASKTLGQREGPAIAVAMLRAQDMGLLMKWSREPLSVGNNKSIPTRKMSTPTENIKFVDRDRRKKLSINALKGVFCMWTFGTSISIVVFFLELVIGSWSQFRPKLEIKPQPQSRQLAFQYCN